MLIEASMMSDCDGHSNQGRHSYQRDIAWFMTIPSSDAKIAPGYGRHLILKVPHRTAVFAKSIFRDIFRALC